MGLLLPKKLQYEFQQRLIEYQIQRILSCCDPSAIILFGSAAECKMTESSDIDIAVLFPDMISLAQARRTLYLMAPGEHSWPCDLLLFTSSEFLEKLQRGGVCEVIREEGRLLFGRWP